MSALVYLALGTNLGMRAANLRAALAHLPPKVRVRRVSSLYETPPWGYVDQSAFLNQVIEAETDLSPHALLAYLKQIEARLGRKATFRYGPRVIDLDILSYDNQIIDQQDLTIPHPNLHERPFVLVPLAQIAPQWLHPRSHHSVQHLLAQLNFEPLRPISHALPAFGLRTWVMGILNITDDSFSGDGLLRDSSRSIEMALQQARAFVQAGADILDVGGESTRPGATPMSESEEQARVLPVIEALAREFNPRDAGSVLISVDTCKARVAQVALQAGAHWINDVWGLRADPAMASVAAAAGVPVVLMHNRLKPASAELQARLGGRYVGVHYDNLVADVQHELRQSLQLAQSAGIREELIILDPGIGFGKTVEQSLTLIDRLNEICDIGYPVLLGPSRKSFIGYTLDLPADQRVEGTAAAIAIGIDRGADIVRVHDVAQMVRVARMTDALTRRGRCVTQEEVV